LNDDDTENRKPQTENGKLIFLPNFAQNIYFAAKTLLLPDKNTISGLPFARLAAPTQFKNRGRTH